MPVSEAVDVYAAVAQMGRQQRAGGTLIEQLVGVVAENFAFQAVARRLNEFSADDLRRLATAWAELRSAPSLEEALRGERDAFFVPILRNVVLPGLTAELSGDAGEGTSVEGSFDDLRLSALVDLGGDERSISLEKTATGETFTLREGRTVNGVELLSIDFGARRAIIRRDGSEGVVNLDSKAISSRRRDGRRLRELMGFSTEASGDGFSERYLAWVAAVRKHPGGLEGYEKDLNAEYDLRIAEQMDLATQAKLSEHRPELPDDLILRTLMPTMYALSRNLTRAGLSTDMLQAAIQMRLADLGAADERDAVKVVDPWATDCSGFVYQKTADGGFQLSSAYEAAPDQGTTFKFAAPDAGYLPPDN